MLFRSIIQFVIAAVLFAAGAAAWNEARTARRVADAYQRFATLRYDVDDRIGETASLLDRVPLPIQTLGTDVRRHRTLVNYWRGDYAPLTAPMTAADQQAAAVDPAAPGDALVRSPIRGGAPTSEPLADATRP